MDVIIRPLTSEDTAAVKKLVLDGLSEFGFSYTPSLDYDLTDPQTHYIQTGGMFYVLLIDGTIRGTVGIKHEGKTAEVKRLYVAKQFQGKGYGAKLLDTAIQFCKDHTYQKIILETNKKFEKAHMLYKKRGFIMVHEDDSSYYMEKEIFIKKL